MFLQRVYLVFQQVSWCSVTKHHAQPPRWTIIDSCAMSFLLSTWGLEVTTQVTFRGGKQCNLICHNLETILWHEVETTDAIICSSIHHYQKYCWSKKGGSKKLVYNRSTHKVSPTQKHYIHHPFSVGFCVVCSNKQMGCENLQDLGWSGSGWKSLVLGSGLLFMSPKPGTALNS